MAIQLIPSSSSIPTKAAKKAAYARALIIADAEFAENLECLESLRIIEREELDYPICRLKTNAGRNLFRRYYVRLDDFAYGEEYSVLDQWAAIEIFDRSLANMETAPNLATLRKGEISLRDAYFLQAFLRWYISPQLSEQKVGSDQVGKWSTPQDITGYSDSA